MKKFLALLLAVATLLSCAAFAEEAAPAIHEMDPELIVTIDRKAHLTSWEGKWVLAAAYIGEYFIEEFELEGIEPGLYPVKENAMWLDLSAVLNESANDKSLGAIVDQGSYVHADVYDLVGTVTFAEEYTKKTGSITSKWNQFGYLVTGEHQGYYTHGPAKTTVKAADDFLFWNEITGIAFEESEEMKYIFMNTSGHIVLCFPEKNITNKFKDNELAAKQNDEIGLAYIFEFVSAPETPFTPGRTSTDRIP